MGRKAPMRLPRSFLPAAAPRIGPVQSTASVRGPPASGRAVSKGSPHPTPWRSGERKHARVPLSPRHAELVPASILPSRSGSETVMKTNPARCRTQDAGCRMQDAGCRMRNAECGMRNAECGMRNAECGMRNAECGMRNAKMQPRHILDTPLCSCESRSTGRQSSPRDPSHKNRLDSEATGQTLAPSPRARLTFCDDALY